jgi:pyruvate dehydrogenase E1 component beta subunit
LGNGNGVYNSYLTKARVARDGDDLAIITYGATLPLSLETADRLSAEGIEARVIDLRSIFPLDVDAIVKAASECGRALVVHEAPRTAGIGAEVSALIHERAMLDLEAPVGRVTGFDVPFPQFANEDDYLPSVDRIYQGAKKVLSF